MQVPWVYGHHILLACHPNPPCPESVSEAAGCRWPASPRLRRHTHHSLAGASLSAAPLAILFPRSSAPIAQKSQCTTIINLQGLHYFLSHRHFKLALSGCASVTIWVPHSEHLILASGMTLNGNISSTDNEGKYELSFLMQLTGHSSEKKISGIAGDILEFLKTSHSAVQIASPISLAVFSLLHQDT